MGAGAADEQPCSADVRAFAFEDRAFTDAWTYDSNSVRTALEACYRDNPRARLQLTSADHTWVSIDDDGRASVAASLASLGVDLVASPNPAERDWDIRMWPLQEPGDPALARLALAVLREQHPEPLLSLKFPEPDNAWVPPNDQDLRGSLRIASQIVQAALAARCSPTLMRTADTPGQDPADGGPHGRAAHGAPPGRAERHVRVRLEALR